MRVRIALVMAVLLGPCPRPAATSGDDGTVDLGDVTEKQVMVQMRDGVRLSVYLYFPRGKGPWPVLLEQRYANARDAGSRTSFARLAAHGYVVALQSFRGSQQSEGKWVGYRALGWGERQDGYDTVEWLAQQPWSTGKVGTFGSSQAGFAQNFLPPEHPADADVPGGGRRARLRDAAGGAHLHDRSPDRAGRVDRAGAGGSARRVERP